MSSDELLGRLSEPESARLLIRESISDERRCAALSAWATEALASAGSHERALALHVTRGLGLRSTAVTLTELLDESWLMRPNPLYQFSSAREPLGDGVSRFTDPVAYYAHSTLCETALRLSFSLLPQGHPRHAWLLNWALQALAHEPQLISALWEAWPPTKPLRPLLGGLPRLLSSDPEVGATLAVRVALFQPEEALELCSALAQLEELQLEPFRQSLHKQLMRVRRVKLWRECRSLLNSCLTKSTHEPV